MADPSEPDEGRSKELSPDLAVDRGEVLPPDVSTSRSKLNGDAPGTAKWGSEPDKLVDDPKLNSGRQLPAARGLYRHSVDRSVMLTQQLANAVIDLVFLSLWAAVTAGLDAILQWIDASWWVRALAFLGDACTFLIVLSFIVNDVIVSLRQTWRKGDE